MTCIGETGHHSSNARLGTANLGCGGLHGPRPGVPEGGLWRCGYACWRPSNTQFGETAAAKDKQDQELAAVAQW
jgi:hypothetical protein